jgi:hypothetical protein
MILAETPPLQLILPTDKRNPSFSLYLTADEQAIHVFYGLELLEVVPADREHTAYKMLVARLYNAGLRVRSLAEVFDLDPKTMRAWGRALRSRDPALLQRMVLGPEAGRKRTAAIDGYVRQRWPQLLGEGCRNYREKLQQEIERIFDTRLSGETLRLLMAQIKTEGAPAPGATVPAESPDEPRAKSPAAGAELAALDEGSARLLSSPARGASAAAGEVVRSSALRESTCSDHPPRAEDPPALPCAAATGEDAAAMPPPASSKSTPSFWTPAPGASILCDHAGLLLFARALAMEPQVLLCDEITSALDPELKHEVLDVLEDLRRDGLTLIMVTHEIGFARRAADRVVVLAGGKIVEDGPPAQVLDAPQTERTRRFLQNVLG